MKKIIFYTSILLIIFQSCVGQTNDKISHKENYIDSVQNAQQINELISKIDTLYKDFKVNDKMMFTDKNCQRISDSLRVQPWSKADFDNNGLTDILIVGNWFGHSVICILDKESKYEIKRIAKGLINFCTFPIVDNDKIKYFFESESESGNRNEPWILKQITLVYKFGDFIEFNRKPANHKIEKIEYSTTFCYGTCPVFNITIDSNKTAMWVAEVYNKINNQEVTGKFKSTITEEKYNNIVDLLNYIDFENLKDNYEVNWTDDQTSTLKVTYDNGKVKTIEDYGLSGTYGLNKLYRLLFELRENQNWIK